MTLTVKNPPTNARDVSDASLMPGLARSLEKGMATHCSIFAWKIPWTEAGGLQSIGSQRVGHNKGLSMHAIILKQRFNHTTSLLRTHGGFPLPASWICRSSVTDLSFNSPLPVFWFSPGRAPYCVLPSLASLHIPIPTTWNTFLPCCL